MRLFGIGRKSDPIAEMGELLASAYGVDKVREAFGVYWRREYAPVLEWSGRPPLVEGFVEFLKADGVKAQIGGSVGDPSPAALADAKARESALIEWAVRGEALEELRPISWAEVPRKVLIPAWRERARAHERGVEGLTVGGAGRAATDPIVIGKRLVPHDTQPYLEAPVLATTGIQALEHAVAVALVDGGGVVRAALGEPYAIEIGGGRIEPWVAIPAVAAGEMRVAQWENLCRRLEVAHLSLGGGRR